jgi:hypothetical protein
MPANYAFGDSELARERLALVADTFAAPTRQLLDDLPACQPRYVIDMGRAMPPRCCRRASRTAR